MTATTAIIQVEADPAFHGRILALQTFLLIGTTPIGGPILGWLADTAGPRAPIVLGGIVSLATAGWGLAARRVVARGAARRAAPHQGGQGPAPVQGGPELTPRPGGGIHAKTVTPSE